MQAGPDTLSAVDTKTHFEGICGMQHSMRSKKQECILIRVNANLFQMETAMRVKAYSKLSVDT
jgi:hypothetical protein